jgi:hypothetical protein
MNSSEIETELVKLESERSDIAKKLDAIVEEFRAELPGLAEPWIRAEVERRITANPEKVKELGLKHLKALKSGLADLISGLPQIARRETEERAAWPHYRGDGEIGSAIAKNDPFFDHAFRRVISHLAPLLDHFGLLTEPTGHVQVWERLGNGKFRYAANPGFIDMEVASNKKFYDSFPRWAELGSRIQRLKKDLAQAQAKELWDSA